MQRLRGLDTAFLYLESPTNHLHVTWAAVLDTRADPGAASVERLSGLVADRLHRLPALRKRLVDPHLGYTQPDWIDVDVDPADHCTRHHGSDLEAVAAEVLASPLDRGRPLWEMHTVEGLPGGRTGLIVKVHHALLDGPSGAELFVQLLDLEPAPDTAPPPTPLTADPQPDTRQRRRIARRRARRGTLRAASEMGRAAAVLAATQRWDLTHAPLPGGLGAPRTPFNRPITDRREVRFTGVPLDVLDAVRCGSGATINDAVLAITGGALRRYLARRAALPSAPLLAMVPMSTRGPGGEDGGNRLSALVTTLGTDVADPAARLATVAAATKALKARHDESGMGSLVDVLDVVPPRAGQGFARLMQTMQLSRWAPLAFNVVVSNVPGPDVPFYCNGALVESAHPMGPITDWSAINVTVVSYRRHLSFGLVSCPDVVADLDELRDDVDAEIAALCCCRPPSLVRR